MRLKKVLPNIINNAQTGYLPGRFIGENIRLISDILHYTADQNLEGIALFIDFEKAFDSLEWEYLDKALDAFNFGLDFKVWIRTLYNNISSCTINNGYASKPFTLKRGVRQGCPLSGLLFILAAEVLSCAIRSRSDIRGILVANKEIKLSQYADDTTAFCKDEASLEKLLEVLNLFEECSGLKLNSSADRQCRTRWTYPTEGAQHICCHQLHGVYRSVLSVKLSRYCVGICMLILLINFKLEMGRKLVYSSKSSDSFLSLGLTIASFNCPGIHADWSDRLTTLVSVDKKVDLQLLWFSIKNRRRRFSYKHTRLIARQNEVTSTR